MRIRVLNSVAVVFAASLLALPGCISIGVQTQLNGTWTGFLNGTTTTTPAVGSAFSTPSSTAAQLIYTNNVLTSYQLLAFGDLPAKTVTINQVGQSVSFNVNAAGVPFSGVATVTNAVYNSTSSTVVVAISLVGPLSNGSGVQTLNTTLNSNGTLNVTVTQNISYVTAGLTTTATTNASGTLTRQ